MHIALNAHLLSFANTYRGAGISRYIANLIRGLQEFDPGNFYTVFLGAKDVPGDFFGNRRFRPAYSRAPTGQPAVRVLWEQLAQPVLVNRLKPDLLHSLAFVRPLFCPVASVVTVYDVSFALYPDSFKIANRLYLTYFTRHSARAAQRVVAISENTRRDLVRLWQVSPDRIFVVYPGLEEHFAPITEPEKLVEFRRTRGLPEHFILYVGTLEPRKNVEGLLRAFSLLLKTGSHVRHLVLAGARGWKCQDLFDLIETLNLQQQVITPGYIAQAELPWWYAAADAFVYPSRYEGFGLPILEAMACGTPVVASNVSSIPEAAGDAALLVEPADVEAFSAAIRSVLDDNFLRQDMIRRGLLQAQRFTRRRMAEGMLGVYSKFRARAAKRAGS